MSKKSWPKITRTENHGKISFVVDARIAGKGERKFFATRVQAEGYASSARTRRLNEGESVFNDEDLARHGWTVAMAIRFALDHLNRQAASAPVGEVLEKLIAAKTAAGRRAGYCNELRWRLSKFVDFSKGKTVAQVSVQEIEHFLSSLSVAPGTWNTYRRDLVTLWSYAVKSGLALTNIAQKTERASEVDAPPGILSPKQAAAILAASVDEDVRAAHAIGFFAGLRVSEINKLDWSDVDFKSGHIHVSAATSKTRSRRLVPILPNLVRWLKPIVKGSGKITGANFRRRSAAAKAAAKSTPWPENAMRHSFVSYRLAATGDAAKTALESGHDQAVLFRHYRELVQPKVAKQYFNIRPGKANNAIAIPGAVLPKPHEDPPENETDAKKGRSAQRRKRSETVANPCASA